MRNSNSITIESLLTGVSLLLLPCIVYGWTGDIWSATTRTQIKTIADRMITSTWNSPVDFTNLANDSTGRLTNYYGSCIYTGVPYCLNQTTGREYDWDDFTNALANVSSPAGVQQLGNDCSGFLSMCWKLPESISTRELAQNNGNGPYWTSLGEVGCVTGSDFRLLRGDALNYNATNGDGHVMMFLRYATGGYWTMEQKWDHAKYKFHPDFSELTTYRPIRRSMILNEASLDFEQDGKSDVAVYWPGGGSWNILESSGQIIPVVQFGAATSVAVAADYDGDGKTDMAVYAPATGMWNINHYASHQTRAVQWGWSQAIPVPADYDGDGKADIATYVPATGQWLILQSHDGRIRSVQWGWSQAMPVPADYDGDGMADIATYFPASGQWWILQSFDGTLRYAQWGWREAMPVPADYDGDGKADLSVYIPSTGTWNILQSHNGSLKQQNWGYYLAAAVPGDYDGDGQADIATYHPPSGMWFILKSTGGMTQQQWGWIEAVPVLPQFQINRQFFPSP